MSQEDWRDEAACFGLPTEWFFPERSDSMSKAEIESFAARGISITRLAPRNDRRAKAVCSECPVAAECMATAVAKNEEHGVWAVGGQRRRYLRRQYMNLPWAEFELVMQLEVELLRNGYARTETQPLRKCARCERQGWTAWLPAGVYPEDVNGLGARCGRAVTYARGCRCWYCRLAHSMRINTRISHWLARATDEEDRQAYG
jgi:Transcription factor WhiB